MKPEVDQILMITAGQVMGELTPNLPTQYAQGVAQIGAVLTILAAQEYDRAAEIRSLENREMRALFAKLAPEVGDADLKARLEAASRTEDTSIRISVLNESNYALRNLLIALHEEVESRDGSAARQAETQIWTLLKAMAARRQLYLPGG